MICDRHVHTYMILKYLHMYTYVRLRTYVCRIAYVRTYARMYLSRTYTSDLTKHKIKYKPGTSQVANTYVCNALRRNTNDVSIIKRTVFETNYVSVYVHVCDLREGAATYNQVRTHWSGLKRYQHRYPNAATYVCRYYVSICIPLLVHAVACVWKQPILDEQLLALVPAHGRQLILCLHVYWFL